MMYYLGKKSVIFRALALSVHGSALAARFPAVAIRLHLSSLLPRPRNSYQRRRAMRGATNSMAMVHCRKLEARFPSCIFFSRCCTTYTCFFMTFDKHLTSCRQQWRQQTSKIDGRRPNWKTLQHVVPLFNFPANLLCCPCIQRRTRSR